MNATPVAFETIALSRKGPRGPKYVVIRDAAAYAKLFSGKPPAEPAVDFERDMVLAAALGRRSGCSRVEIKTIELDKPFTDAPGKARVILDLARLPEGAHDTDAGQPFHVVKLAKTDVEFAFCEPRDGKLDLIAAIDLASSVAGMVQPAGPVGLALDALGAAKSVKRLNDALHPPAKEFKARKLSGKPSGKKLK